MNVHVMNKFSLERLLNVLKGYLLVAMGNEYVEQACSSAASIKKTQFNQMYSL